jgi:hypothetical protein
MRHQHIIRLPVIDPTFRTCHEATFLKCATISTNEACPWCSTCNGLPKGSAFLVRAACFKTFGKPSTGNSDSCSSANACSSASHWPAFPRARG